MSRIVLAVALLKAIRKKEKHPRIKAPGPHGPVGPAPDFCSYQWGNRWTNLQLLLDILMRAWLSQRIPKEPLLSGTFRTPCGTQQDSGDRTSTGGPPHNEDGKTSNWEPTS